MAWRRKGHTGDEIVEGTEPVEIFKSGNGMVVEGTPSAVTAFIDQMVDATEEAGGKSTHFVVQGFQIAANIAAFSQTHRQYFEHSARALELLQQHGAIATKDGYFERLCPIGAQSE